MFGGDGNDDQLSGGFGGPGNHLIFGGDGNDTLLGNDGLDQIFAGAGNDFLYGGADNDIVDGGLGTDVLQGNEGNDILFGGSNPFAGEADYFLQVQELTGSSFRTFPAQTSSRTSIVPKGTRTVSQGTAINSFAAVLANATFNAAINSTIITVSPSENVFIFGQSPATLLASDFVFS